MKTYKLPIDKIIEVKGEFTTLYNDGEFVYVEPSGDEELSEPFILSELPARYIQTIQEALEFAKTKKISELNRRCDKLLEKFTSNALGEEYIYDGRQEDQINLMGLLIAGVDGFFRCAKASDDTNKQNYPHTKEQIKQVYNDGLKYKSETIYQCGILKEYLKHLSSIDEVKALKWEDYDSINELMRKNKGEVK